jgi:hypothetical protein
MNKNYGTIEDEARRLVEGWQKANHLHYLVSRVVDDLVERIVKALVLERAAFRDQRPNRSDERIEQETIKRVVPKGKS